jgi:shikimate kinase
VTEGRTDPLPGTPIVVMGLMGSGKTTVASRLATHWDRPLRDSDQDLRTLRGVTAAQLVDEHGREALHAWESDHLLASLEDPRAVVAAAASAVEDPRCRVGLSHAAVVWLDVALDELTARQASGGHRPVYDRDLTRMLSDMDARRRPLFHQVADVVVRIPEPGSPAPPADADAVRDRQTEIDSVVARVVTGLERLPHPHGQLPARGPVTPESTRQATRPDRSDAPGGDPRQEQRR